ncbi:polysaccharide biosynthesis tyrosine autokinase [Fontivita pretiosa]|uniref:polysaccharide biosynthesis tyrosine autokinase n=1 Tax=Fontivita pretiosa TaxID=2989684 RepID=UPI003D17C234
MGTNSSRPISDSTSSTAMSIGNTSSGGADVRGGGMVVGEPPQAQAGLLVAPPQQQANPLNLLLVVHSLLRGRYWLAILLAMIGMIVGAGIGYNAIKPKYRSMGMVRIRPYVEKIMYDTDRTQMIPMFPAFMEAQVVLIRTPRMIELAMEDPRWKDLGRPHTQAMVQDFLGKLDVSCRGEMINIEFTDEQPEATYRAVNALIDAYARRFEDQDSERYAGRMEKLEERRSRLEAELKLKNDAILAIGNQYGSTALQKIYEFNLEELNKVVSQLRLAELALAAGEAQLGNHGPQPKPDADPARTDPAMGEALMNEYLRRAAAERANLRQLELSLGANHPQVVKTRAWLDQLEKDIRTLQQEVRIAPAGLPIAPLAMQSLESLRENERRIRELHDKIKAETLELGRKNVQIEALRQEAAKLQTDLDETRSLIEKLQVEASAGERLSIISYAEPPLGPDKDRRLPVAAAGGMALGGLGVGIVLLLGLLDRRLHRIADAEARLPQANRVLGVLPALPEDLSDPEQSSIAAHCVHQIRTLLQIQQNTSGHRVLSVTSPSPGDGKTSLTIALGMSFAASGSKTLLIDCDMQGGGLTSRLIPSGSRRLGQILLRERRITEEQLGAALEESQRLRRPLGEVLLGQRLISSEVLDRALLKQRRMRAGLSGVIKGEVLGDCIVSTGTRNLHLLPLGVDDHRFSSQLSPAMVGSILDEAARHYDTVLVDTGPVLGSLEAAVVASEVDGVVLTVSRGADRNLAHNAIRYLATMNAQIEGIVFNRAKVEDIRRSTYSGSVSAASARQLPSAADSCVTGAGAGSPATPTGRGPTTRHWVRRLGPIACAVAEAEAEQHAPTTPGAHTPVQQRPDAAAPGIHDKR